VTRGVRAQEYFVAPCGPGADGACKPVAASPGHLSRPGAQAHRLPGCCGSQGTARSAAGSAACCSSPLQRSQPSGASPPARSRPARPPALRRTGCAAPRRERVPAAAQGAENALWPGDTPAHLVLRRLAHPLPAPCAGHARALLAPRVRLLCPCRSPPLQRAALALRRRGTDAWARGRVSAGRSWLWDLRRSDALAQMHTVQVHERDWSPARVAEEGSAQALDEALEGLERMGGGALMLVGDFMSRDIVADPESLREIRARIALPPRFRALCTLLRIPSLCPGGARLTRSGVRASRLRQEAARLFTGLELVFELPSLAAWVQVRRRAPPRRSSHGHPCALASARPGH
jgi:hypothetical protein